MGIDAEERAEEAKLKAEAEMRAKIEAEIRAKIEAEAKAEQEARARAEAEMRSQIEAELRAKLKEEVAKAASAEDTKAPKASRPRVSDTKLEASLNWAFDRLELYYPEHKVFAFDSIDGELRERMAELYKKAGYISIDDMLHAYGFEIISGSKVKELRSSVLYTPGNEPDFIKNKVDNMLVLLAEYYPDHIIPRGIENDHKKLAGKISGLYRWLGYETQKDFLAAYGYEYNNAVEGGRPAQNFQAIIDTLVAKYQDGPKPKNMGAILFDNPDLKGPLKSLQNKSNELFGMTLKKYFEQIGIFAPAASGGRGDSRINRAASTGIQGTALASLTALYEQLDADIYGTVDNMIACLEGMNVKQNKGQVYIFCAVNCDRRITIPYGIDFLSVGAFSGQRELEDVTIKASLTEIPMEAFSDCTSLSSIVIPEGVMTIGESAFMNCTSLQSIIIPASVQQIANKAFAGCTALKDVKILNPRTLIGDSAFEDCLFEYEPCEETGIATPVEFFDYSVDRRGNISINGFTGDMESVTIPGMIDGRLVTTIGKGAFQGNQRIVDVSMSDYITTMQGDAFRDCISLKRIYLSNGISKIITSTFNGCIGLQEVNIPDAVTEIKRSTFKDSPVTQLHIGKQLRYIDSKPFYNGEIDSYTGQKKTTRAINKITVDPENPYLKASGAAVLSKDGKILEAFLGNARKYSVPEGVEHIANSAFEGLAFLSDVTLPDSVAVIGEKAFKGTALRSISFGRNAKVIKDSAFASCDKLTSAIFNDGLEEIERTAFEDCPIVSVVLPASLESLGHYSFSCLSTYYYGEQKQQLTIDGANPYLKADGKALYQLAVDGMTLQQLYGPEFRQYYFDNRKGETYEVAAGTVHIAPEAFSGCSNLSKVTIPDGVLSIGENAFADCQKLKEVNLPDSIESIGSNAFMGTSVKSFKLGAAVKHIGKCAFITGNKWENKRTSLRSIKVDKANTAYFIDRNTLLKKKDDGTNAVIVYFGGDETLILPDGVSEIYPGAFMRSIIQEIHIPSSVTTIGEHAFSGCSKLVRLRVGFAEPENGASFAVIYIPENSSGNNYAGDTIHDQYMDCIRVDGSETVFDFVKYDSLFDTITAAKDKILVATDRLKSAIQLVPLYREKYLTYLRKHAKKAVEIVVEFDDLSGLNTLAELEVFTGKNIDGVIELANKAKKTEILSYLMNYKNSRIGITEEDYDL